MTVASRALACLALLGFVTLSGCGGAGGEEPRTHHAGKGPLSAAGSAGTLTVHPQRAAGQWSMTFGFFNLCTHDGARADLEDVTWKASGPEVEVTPYVRVIPDGPDREPGLEYAPLNERGTPDSLREWVGGTFDPDISQHTVTTPCDPPADPEGPRNDLAMVVTAGGGGAKVRNFWVTYKVGEESYRLSVDYALIMCGTRVQDPTCKQAGEGH